MRIRTWLGLAFILAVIASAACSGKSSLESPSTQAAFDLSGVRDSFLFVDDSGGLFELSSAGQRPLLLFDDGSRVLDPAISPDGQRLAFGLQVPATRSEEGIVDFGSDLYLASRQGGASELALEHEAVAEFIRTPVWLPDNRHIVLEVQGRAASGAADWRIEIFDSETGARQRLADNGTVPALSPDAATLAFVETDIETFQQDIVLIDLATGERRSVLGPESSKLLINAIAWSPDGSRLAFTAADPLVSRRKAPDRSSQLVSLALHPTLQDVWLVDRDGADLWRLADLAESQPSITWSSDGESLFVLGGSGFWQIEVSSSERRSLGPGSIGQIAPLP